VSTVLAAGETVRVVAATLANGAPHPFVGRTGLVDEVRAVGQHPVRVLVDGRAIMFAVDELERHAGDVAPGISDDETHVRDVR
jgi:hypothetical protein